eukprot:TRINITY_DN279_c0_g3_i10.p3 TRINITY_DN279_c0_g3~~TRINITY_DN279_c0_g3_i10.p3  ORF type:complete len:100 (+),score=10.82 TRINITY_DN279_c0_g3_i10:890-1189(+)
MTGGGQVERYSRRRHKGRERERERERERTTREVEEDETSTAERKEETGSKTFNDILCVNTVRNNSFGADLTCSSTREEREGGRERVVSMSVTPRDLQRE